MTLKKWMQRKGNDVRTQDARGRTPAAAAAQRGEDAAEPRFTAFGRRGAGVGTDPPVHLGPYAPLIGAIREELEHFVTNQLRLHLAIAERDRYVLASIEVECDDGDAERDLMRRFTREFRPEQIKQYLAKEIIAGLRNASAIDLSQFAGLNAERDDASPLDDGERYGDLIAELASGAPRNAARPYRVTLVGRWSELAPPAQDERAAPAGGPRTPLAARPVVIRIEDARGQRRVDLAVVPGQRYSIGKDAGCDVVVEGNFTSRRHCEVWFDKGAWWAADAGSANGVRVESADGHLTGASESGGGPTTRSIEWPPGTTLVLAADVHGDARDYPCLSLQPSEATRKGSARAAPSPERVGATPVTPIALPRRGVTAWTLTARMASGVRTVDLGAGDVPFRVGRSRNQALVIDWTHVDVSGHHLEIVALDATGADVQVHGDNGVTVDASTYGPGARFHWSVGQTLRLGASAGEASCDLTLAAAA
jgi:hypothetical protein